MSKVKITQGYKDLNSLNLDKEFIRDHKLVTGREYRIVVAGMSDMKLAGTIRETGLIPGLAGFYQRFPDLRPGAEVPVGFDGFAITVQPPAVVGISDATDRCVGWRLRSHGYQTMTPRSGNDNSP